MSNTLVRPDDTNLSPSRTSDGNSADATSILVLDSAAIRRSDSGDPIVRPLTTAPPARTSRRGFLMNSIIALPIASAIPTSAPAMFTEVEPDPVLGAAKEISRQPDAELIAAGREFASLLVRLNEIGLIDGPRTKEWFRATDALAAAYYPRRIPDEALEALNRRLDEKFPETAPGNDEIIEKLCALELKIMSLPPTTFDGVKPKIQVLRWRVDDPEEDDMEWEQKLLRRFIFEVTDPIAASKETFTENGSRPRS
jgi:hypothetical protein